MQAVHQRVVAQQRQREHAAAAPDLRLPPGDPGIAVRRAGRGLDQRGVAHPGEGADEEIGERVLVLLDVAVRAGGIFARFGVGQELVQGQIGAHRTVGVGLVVLGDDEGAGADVKLPDLTVHDALAQLGHRIGGPRHAVQQREEEGTAAARAVFGQRRDVYVRGQAHIRVGHCGKVGEVIAPEIGCEVDFVRAGDIFHGNVLL